MDSEELLDEGFEKNNTQKKVYLHSKASIALVFIFLSPYYASYLYGVNLYRTGQYKKIFGTVTTLILCNLAVLVGILGFDLSQEVFSVKIYLHYFISRSVTSLLILLPIWKKHFKKQSYKTIFDYKTVGILFAIKVLLTLVMYNSIAMLLDFRSSFIIQPVFLGLILIVKNVIDLILGKPFKMRDPS
ncbi:hypothetical protein [Parvicella tangerina]|uniref:Uncharacterized protein n=1 Tax=Parvicella tangerina TaxID=2829795 RepID=A0A916JK78_9FLAO|nr:hypothetical protein [Parvicella tangerina]CAG5078507.1 hypothetical protein CRYO30217_00693 [Parvicella tangerina]